MWKMMKAVRHCAIVALLAFPTRSVAIVARQTSADEKLPGPGLTRQQIVDRLTAGDYQAKPSLADGKQLFQGLCSNCHIFGEMGASLGPDLSTVGSRFRNRDLLESILFPSKTISDQYVMTTVTLDDGSTQNGLVSREDENFVFLRTADQPEGRGVPIPVGRIKERKESDVSMMPDGLVAGLTLEQIHNIVAFLLTGK
jgi:putative heme-binding domain-containing protein